MVENKDPITCTECGTVNPWMNDTCRSCGADLTQQEPVKAQVVGDTHDAQEGEAPRVVGADESVPPPPRGASSPMRPRPATSYEAPRLNILWICVGIFAYILVVVVGEFLIARWLIAPEPHLKDLIERAQSQNTEISDSDREELRSMLFGNPAFWVLVILLTLGLPFLIAATVGYFTHGLREGAAALGIGVFILCLMERQVLAGIIAGALYVGLGLVGAMTGNWYRHKQRLSQR